MTKKEAIKELRKIIKQNGNDLRNISLHLYNTKSNEMCFYDMEHIIRGILEKQKRYEKIKYKMDGAGICLTECPYIHDKYVNSGTCTFLCRYFKEMNEKKRFVKCSYRSKHGKK